jgi:hypothetical protein
VSTPKYVYLRVPADAWGTLSETLCMDMQAGNIDQGLRDEIEEAYDTVEEVEYDMLLAALDRLTRCPDLNMDSLELETIEALAQANIALLKATVESP